MCSLCLAELSDEVPRWAPLPFASSDQPKLLPRRICYVCGILFCLQGAFNYVCIISESPPLPPPSCTLSSSLCSCIISTTNSA